MIVVETTVMRHPDTGKVVEVRVASTYENFGVSLVSSDGDIPMAHAGRFADLEGYFTGCIKTLRFLGYKETS